MKLKFPNVFDYFKASKEAITDFSKERKHTKQLKSKTIIVQETGIAEIEPSYTDESSMYLINPNSYSLALDLHPIYLNGEKFFIQSKNDHNTLNIKEISEIMNDVKYKADLFLTLNKQEKEQLLKLLNESDFGKSIIEKFKNPEIVFRLHIDNIKCTINPHFFANKFSYSFVIQAFKVISTKILTFLEDTVSRKLWIASIIIAILFGIILGSIFGGFIIGVLSGFLFFMIK